MPRKKTHDEFLRDARAIHGDEYEYLELYKGVFIKMPMKHLKCGNIFYMKPDKHINAKQRCSHCYKAKEKTNSEFVTEAIAMHGHRYEYISGYIGWEEKMTIKCLVCKYVFDQKSGSHLRGQGCPKCGGTMKKTTEEFIEDAKRIRTDFADYDYGEAVYVNSETHLKLKHKICGLEVLQTPDNHLQKYGCNRCTSKNYSKESINWLKTKMIDFPDIQHAENGGEFRIPETRYSADGYSAEYNIVFEFHGCFYHGCVDCYPNRELVNDVCKKTMSELFENTKKKRKSILDLGYEYICAWSCGRSPDLD